ncbi:Uncharacterized protein APZ42_021260 [Daphnia magna]|uniref:Uncharacterized protein n=1 Tax=Daphnia magna TaxID=35525 RepID=A0A164WTW8_9CRUS|nr:Uncharacterized protein APZ42_021260 [Daphnia magna]
MWNRYRQQCVIREDDVKRDGQTRREIDENRLSSPRADEKQLVEM